MAHTPNVTLHRRGRAYTWNIPSGCVYTVSGLLVVSRAYNRDRAYADIDRFQAINRSEREKVRKISTEKDAQKRAESVLKIVQESLF